MSETTTDEVLAATLQAALDAAKVTGNFVVEQAPDLVQQLILYNTVKSGLYTVLFGTLTVVGPTVTYKLFKEAKSLAESSNDYMASMYDFPQSWSGTLIGAISFLWSFFFLGNLSDFLKVTLAPKVWLLEYAASLIK